MNRRRIVWIAWATVLLYVLIAVCLTHMHRPPHEFEEFKDKTLHKAGYFMYAAVIYIAATITWPRLRGLALFVVLALALWAAADEITQPLFGRDCDIMDWRADMIGAITAVVILSIIRFIARRLEHRAEERSDSGPLVPSPGTPQDSASV